MWTIDILRNDVLLDEFKTSLERRMVVLRERFETISTLKTWPDHRSQYGDYVHLCTPK